MCATDQQHPTRPAQPSSRHVIGQATVPAVTATYASGLNDARTALKERARRAHATLARLVWCDAKSRIAAFALQPRSTSALLSSTEAYPRSFRLFHTLRLERKKKKNYCVKSVRRSVPFGRYRRAVDPELGCRCAIWEKWRTDLDARGRLGVEQFKCAVPFLRFQRFGVHSSRVVDSILMPGLTITSSGVPGKLTSNAQRLGSTSQQHQNLRAEFAATSCPSSSPRCYLYSPAQFLRTVG